MSVKPLAHVKVGHYSDYQAKTGLTVLLFDKGLHCGGWICGSAPGSKSVLPFVDSGYSVSLVHGLLLTGGSAYGLSAAQGVMRWQAEHGLGLNVGVTVIPIIPTVCIFDLAYGEVAWPTADQAYQACQQASAEPVELGRVGGGTGATVGKLIDTAESMPGGFGAAQLQNSAGVVVQAFVVVNAAGDVIDEQGNVVAGARDDQQQFVNSLTSVINGRSEVFGFQTDIMNTTLVAVVTNASFKKEALVRIAKMASGGFARAIAPAFTLLDGDIVFAVSTDELTADECVVGSMAAEAVRQAILSAVS